MVPLDGCLANLYEKGEISYEDLMSKCTDQEQIIAKFKKK